MVKIVNEIPAELEDESMEVEIASKEDKQDYEEAVEAKKEVEKEAAPKQEEFDFEIEEEDDTPPQDRNRDPLPKDIVDELENDNLEDYSAKVKARLAQMKKVWHDERRAKEAADRERQEAVAIAQRIINENRQLKQTLSYGEEDYLKTLKEKYVLLNISIYVSIFLRIKMLAFLYLFVAIILCVPKNLANVNSLGCKLL